MCIFGQAITIHACTFWVSFGLLGSPLGSFCAYSASMLLSLVYLLWGAGGTNTQAVSDRHAGRPVRRKVVGNCRHALLVCVRAVSDRLADTNLVLLSRSYPRSCV